MMSEIKILPDNIINQIAAGEVVENPSSVVKELIENSIDSNPTQINIIVKNGGHDLIQVIDDGYGISKDNLALAFARHATSKISTKDDLNQINTLGFRGEALPSIASVSRINIKTNKDGGYQLRLEKGDILKKEKSPIEKGTDIKVKNLFYNTPARKKFLKTPNQELRNITKIVKRFVLSHPKISFLYKADDKIIYNFKSTSLKNRIIQVFGNNFKDNILSVDESDVNCKVSGYVGNLNLVQKRRGNQYIFINDRFIINESLSNSIRNCYESIMQRGEFPFFVLFLNLDPSLFDINVHPTKIEVRFIQKWNVINFINNSIKKVLKQTLKVLPDITYTTQIDSLEGELGLGFNLNSKLDDISQDSIINQMHDSKVEKAIDRLDEYQSNNEAEIKDNKIWQIHNKYLVTEINSGLLVIDQHVAHERVIYEKVKKAFDSSPLPSQSTLFPKTIKFEEEDYSKFLDIVPFLEKIGYKMREFGNNSIIIEGVPSDIKWGNEEDIINDVLDRYIEYEKISSSYLDYLAATYSCKAAVKAGDYLELEERRQLIDNLFATENPYYCPHGRPIVISIKTDELDKRFERK
tara:strand:- start:3642 stop:5381 length:1740 start_codon:yes stop_codon:yes gene_type:complete